jgi:hypothetical protein
MLAPSAMSYFVVQVMLQALFSHRGTEKRREKIRSKYSPHVMSSRLKGEIPMASGDLSHLNWFK